MDWRLVYGGIFLMQIAQVVDEPHVEHAVRFVDDQVAGFLEAVHVLLVVVDEPARRSDEDIDALLQGVHLFLIVDAAVYGEEPEARELAEPLGLMVISGPQVRAWAR